MSQITARKQKRTITSNDADGASHSESEKRVCNDSSTARQSKRRTSGEIPEKCEQRNPYVLPKCCIISGSSGFRSFVDKRTGLRSKENLSSCQLVKNDLLEAARMKKDETMLLKIDQKDHVSIEVRYHRLTCFSTYTSSARNKRKRKAKLSFSSDSKDGINIAYQNFCETVVSPRILDGGEVLYMSNLHDLFSLECKKQNVNTIERRSLKQRMQRDYPQLTFLPPKKKTFSELVLCEKSIPTCCMRWCLTHKLKLRNQKAVNQKMKICFSLQCIMMSSLFDHTQRSMLYTSSLALRNEIAELSEHTKDKYWPPTAENLNLETAEKIVPSSLFNRLSWITGSSEEAEFDKFVSVMQLSHGRRLFQDFHK